MWARYNRVLLGKVLLLLTILLVGGLGILGCIRVGSQPEGGSGVVVANDSLFLGSMGGKLIALLS